MSSHATAETLSAYLDHELVEEEVAELEAHLESCASCSQRLVGMRQVVRKLHHLERMAPPSTLDQLVARRIALAGESHGLFDRLESSLGSFQRQSNTFMLFCLVIALAVITLLFAHALDVARQNTMIPVVFEGPSTPRLVEPPAITDPETGAEVSPAEALEAEEGTRLALGGRIMVRQGNLWVDETFVPDALDEPRLMLEWDSTATRDLMAEDPRLGELRYLEAPVLLRLDGRLVVLR